MYLIFNDVSTYDFDLFLSFWKQKQLEIMISISVNKLFCPPPSLVYLAKSLTWYTFVIVCAS